MEYFQTALTALFSIFALFVITKLIGYRQLAQMSMFDYVNGITIGSIAAELASDLEKFWKCVIALFIYGAVTWLLSMLTDHSIKVRRLINGRAVMLLDNGKLYDKNFRRARLDLNEFLMACRQNGYFDLRQIQSAILEPNGTISILPKCWARPVTPEDLALAVPQDGLSGTVILDGEIMWENLKNMGYDRAWLNKQLERQNFKKLDDIFLAVCDTDGVLTIFPSARKKPRDIFE